MDFLDHRDIAIVGRTKNTLLLKYDKSIIITTDILKWNESVDDGIKKIPTISLDEISNKIDMFAKDFLIETKDSQRLAESVVYGESLVDLLRWIITTLKTHTHPPNGIAIPDFHVEANNRYRNMEVDLLNKHIKTR